MENEVQQAADAIINKLDELIVEVDYFIDKYDASTNEIKSILDSIFRIKEIKNYVKEDE